MLARFGSYLGRLTQVIEVANNVRQFPSVQKYCLMSLRESVHGEFSVIGGGCLDMLQGGCTGSADP